MKNYTIKEVSQLFNLPASTLRYYEDIGILSNISRTSTGKRVYNECHINRLKTICCFKGTGMSISKLKDFFSYEEKGLEKIDDILLLLTEQRNEVEEKLFQLQSDLEHVKRKLNYYGDIKEALDSGTDLPCWKNYKGKQY
ncbi:MerR family transcriptional regulator [Clostridioides difficile]